MTTASQASVAEWYPVAGRALDVVVAAMLLVLALPLLAACALAVRLDSPGPVLFRQERIGRRGAAFHMLKLRSMSAGADDAAHRRHVRRLVRHGEPWVPMDHDPRVTRVGRFLRASGLDELPQLWNVLRGDMSLVGPRPALPYETAWYEARHIGRQAVRPGITGLWQVDGRGTADFEDMIRLDLEYVERRSLLLDLSILARTPMAVLRSRDRF
ncbi:MAG: sugar transferase [Anaerolineae bacterium]